MPGRNQSAADELYLGMKSWARIFWAWASGPARITATVWLLRFARRVRRNLTPRRLFNFPHVLVAFWVLILLWGERWVFESKVDSCAWHDWESWPKGAKPHHLVLVADPQIIDPHSYPGRPWPLSALTVLITDNYLRRGYGAVQTQLHPDSVFFLGDLFDGGREWKTRQAGFVDPKWAQARSGEERRWVDTWHRRYGEDYWLREYTRFGNIFFNRWNTGGDAPGAWQRGRKLVASLPGNHDLGFGAGVQVPVRDRFEAFFGEANRVDVVGNHTVVSVDTVSLSADTSEYRNSHDLRPIYEPVVAFLDDAKVRKRKAVQRELDAWYGLSGDPRYVHDVEEADLADMSRFPHTDRSPGPPDFPTILLTHVPLYRDPGTPCGPLREHWPPTKPPKGQDGPVRPDARNAISVTAGYQYQNVLNEEDSVHLVNSVGNVVAVFSGDDHDYCEVVHSSSKSGVREITVKSMSMAMGVPTPGFLMVSLYNPVDEAGRSVPGTPEKTVQTHLCLLPNQAHTYMKYVSFAILSLVLLAVRAFLVPVLNLTPFALDRDPRRAALPVYKDKPDPSGDAFAFASRSTSSGTSTHRLPSRMTGTASRSANGLDPSGLGASDGAGRWQSRRGRHHAQRRWGWGEGPRITLDEDYYDGGKGAWKSGRGGSAAVGGRQALTMVGREMWTTTWRVTWMAALYWAYLAREA